MQAGSPYFPNGDGFPAHHTKQPPEKGMFCNFLNFHMYMFLEREKIGVGVRFCSFDLHNFSKWRWLPARNETKLPADKGKLSVIADF